MDPVVEFRNNLFKLPEIRITERRIEDKLNLRKKKEEERHEQRRFKHFKEPQNIIEIERLNIDLKYKNYTILKLVIELFLNQIFLFVF